MPQSIAPVRHQGRRESAQPPRTTSESNNFDRSPVILLRDFGEQQCMTTRLDKATRMPARTLLYGFLGFIAIASAVTMFSNPLDPDVGNGSMNPSDWGDLKLKTYLSDVRPISADSGPLESSSVTLFESKTFFQRCTRGASPLVTAIVLSESH